ncbi:hypothetical protein PIB30_054317 [Stylosanthes scabra]|uniref:Uncharacterized protein n=1 Tax=Stylosanthes scabra TaxID=79078 RepID=A0ABU6SJL3_9FABA|nr:hypothetical protein [Stylosanthes scabra]
MCEKNASNREKQTIPHTLGSKTIARKKHELEQLSLLQAEEDSPNEDAFVKLFGKEHPGRVRGMGFGVCPSQVSKSASGSFGGASSCNHESELAKVRSMEVELKENKATTELLKAQLNYFITHYMSGKVPDDFPVASNNEVEDFESGKHKRPSSSASNEFQQNEPSNT